MRDGFEIKKDGSYLSGYEIILLVRLIRLSKWIYMLVVLHVHAYHVKEKWNITWRLVTTVVETDRNSLSEER